MKKIVAAIRGDIWERVFDQNTLYACVTSSNNKNITWEKKVIKRE